HERQYKIRVVERLSEFRRAITSKPLVHSTADMNEEAEEKPANALLDDSAVAALSDKELGTLSDDLIEDVVKQLVAVAGTSSELLEELNSLDDAGLSLLHYVCFYNCSQLVPLLLTHGAIVNQRSAQGQTALHLAAGCGHMTVVKVLVAHHADMTMFDFDCLTPADRAENCGHFDIADYLRSMAEPSPPKTSQNLSFSEMRSFGLFGDQDSSNEHNRKLLLGAFSNMSLHDKCALSLGTKQRRSNSTAECEEHESEHDMEVNSVMDDNDAGKLEAAMQLMGPDELALLEEEARVIQSNVRAWLLRRSYRHMRETTQKLQEVAKESLAKQQLERKERAAVTVQAATRSMLQRKSYLQQRNTAIKVQAAARGIICRKNFANMKKSALASLVIQKNTLGVGARLALRLKEMGIKEPSAVQKKAIPMVLKEPRKDVIIGAETGSGKTLTYLLPLLTRLAQYPCEMKDIRKPIAVIMVPNQELVKQIEKVVEQLDENVALACLTKTNAIPRRTPVLVGTPKAIIQHASPKDLDSVEMIVVDEADMLLGGGFERDTKQVLGVIRNQPLADPKTNVYIANYQKDDDHNESIASYPRQTIFSAISFSFVSLFDAFKAYVS
ncbi:calmodulin-binding transcription activator, partial [Thraustotheca clavata]